MQQWFRPGTAFNQRLKDRPLSWELFRTPVLLVGAMWLFFGLDHWLQLDLYEFGVYPRQWSGLVGVILSPLLHGDLSHISHNSIPILVLGLGLYYFYPRKATPVIWIAWLSSGLLVWLWGRDSYHIGASGLIYALAAFIFLSGLLRSQANLLAFSLLVVFLYGGLVWGLLPVEEHVSYEGHLAGGLSGLALALYFRKAPLHPRVLDQPFGYEDVSDDLSREIEKYGTDYWKQDDDHKQSFKITYHYRGQSEESKDSVH